MRPGARVEHVVPSALRPAALEGRRRGDARHAVPRTRVTDLHHRADGRRRRRSSSTPIDHGVAVGGLARQRDVAAEVDEDARARRQRGSSSATMSAARPLPMAPGSSADTRRQRDGRRPARRSAPRSSPVRPPVGRRPARPQIARRRSRSRRRSRGRASTSGRWDRRGHRWPSTPRASAAQAGAGPRRRQRPATGARRSGGSARWPAGTGSTTARAARPAASRGRPVPRPDPQVRRRAHGSRCPSLGSVVPPRSRFSCSSCGTGAWLRSGLGAGLGAGLATGLAPEPAWEPAWSWPEVSRRWWWRASLSSARSTDGRPSTAWPGRRRAASPRPAAVRRTRRAVPRSVPRTTRLSWSSCPPRRRALLGGRALLDAADADDADDAGAGGDGQAGGDDPVCRNASPGAEGTARWREVVMSDPIVEGVHAVDTTVGVALQGLHSSRLSPSKACAAAGERSATCVDRAC